MDNNSSLFRKIDDILKRDPFETYNQFRERIENIKPVTIGKADILFNSYDKESGICYVNVDWYGWKSVEKININYLFFVLPDMEESFIKGLDNRYLIKAGFEVKGERVYVDTESLQLCLDDVELKLYCLSFQQALFETQEEFREKIRNIRTLPMGKVLLNKEKYDINTGTFELETNFEVMEEVIIPKIEGMYIIIENKLVQEFYEKSESYVFYGRFNFIKGNIVIDLNSLYILYEGNSIPVYCIVLDNTYFDTDEKYKKEIENIRYICVGKASILSDRYNKDEEMLPVYIKWNDWIKDYVSSIREQYIEADRTLSKALYEAGEEYKVYVDICTNNGALNIASIRMINYLGVFEIKYKDVFKSINSLVIEDENVSICDVVAYDSSREDSSKYEVDEKFDFVNGVALIKINGKYNYINEKGQLLGLTNKRLMRYINSKGKYGYMDNIERVTIIQPEYDFIGSFNEGLARININNKWGFINEYGEIVIEPNFEFARDFHENYAAVRVKKILGFKWGYINKTGETAINPVFDEAGEFSSGIAYVKINKFFNGIREGFIYKDGEFHDFISDIV